MKDVPKFVRQRMVQPVGGDHPEANLLAAFAEGGLTGREREQVLSHLGKCATCRETLAVAIPEVSAVQPAAAPSGTRWLRWPMLRWAGVGAAVVVVAAAVVIQSSRRSAEVQRPSLAAPAAKPEQAKEPAKPAVANEVAPVLADRTPRKEVVAERDMRAKAESRTDKKKDAAAGQFANSNSAPAPALANKLAEINEPVQLQAATGSYAAAQPARVQQRGSTVAGAGAAGAVAMEQKQQQQAAAPAPSASQTVEVVPDAAAVQQADVAAVQKAKSQDNERVQFGRVSGSAAPRAAEARTKAGAPSGVARDAIAPSTATVTGGPLMKAAISIPPHWRLSSEGALERSTDAGRTWQLVRVAATPTILRSFSSLGRDIWAGGSGGALYRSADYGRTWARVTVKAGDRVLDSDIVRVEFTDAQHGALMTVSGETWMTSDAGLTWSVRR
ncbi:MAG: zf-HC2 domain-containing protein [Acidobacteriia bacterium]|nr:zf-HC2 domain-containing protein [Terriglobia bacterium]